MRMAPPRYALATTFANAAFQYWVSVFPAIRRERRHWHNRAKTIPDPTLRRLALEAQSVKQGNVEGSAAFAAFAPRRHRKDVVRAQVAFQSIYDYVDTLTEQPNDDPILNGKQLHQALLAALGDRACTDYYAHNPQQCDNGYLQEIIDACRHAVRRLPSHASIERPARTLAARIVAYQSLNLSKPHGGHHALRRWALTETADTGLQWWETAASAGSSLGIFALISAAAQPGLSTNDATRIEGAYWPWIGALHSLLDSAVDQAEDITAGQYSLLDYYDSTHQAAGRLRLLTTESLRSTTALPDKHQHAVVLAAMACHYLSAPEAASPLILPIGDAVLKAVGGIASATMPVFTARRYASRVATHLKRPQPKPDA